MLGGSSTTDLLPGIWSEVELPPSQDTVFSLVIVKSFFH